MTASATKQKARFNACGGWFRAVCGWIGLRAIDRYIAGAILLPVAAIVAALGLLMLLERALVLLSEMTTLGMSAQFFLPLMVRLIPYYLMQAIPAAFVAALILTIGRMAGDHEWDVMSAAGMANGRMVRPMAMVGVFLALITLIVSGWLEPIGRYGYRSMHAFAVSESRLRTLQSQMIYAPSSDAMLTADTVGNDGLHGVFLWLAGEDGTESVATSPRGLVGMRRDPYTLEFQMDGGVMVSDTNQMARFTTLSGSHPLGVAATARARGRDARELTLSELAMQDPSTLARKPRRQRLAEMYERIARSFSIIVLPWIVLPLYASMKNRRQKRWPAVALIVALVVIFYHGVNFTGSLVTGGSLSVWVASALSAVLPVVAAAGVWRAMKAAAAGKPVSSSQPWWSRVFSISKKPSARDVAMSEPERRRKASVRRSGFRRGLSLYVSGKLLAMTLTVLACLVLLLQLVDLFERGDVLVHSGAGLAGFGYYMWCRLPTTVLQAMPIAMLGGALLAWARMRTSSELVAMQAAGISAFGILRRALIVPVSLGVAMIAIAEFWSPVSQVAFSQWWQSLSPADSDYAPDKPRWFRMGGEIVHAAMADAHGSVLSAPHIYRRADDGRLSERISAESAAWNGTSWHLAGVVRGRLTAAGLSQVPLAGYVWKTALTPTQVRQFFAAPVPISGRDAWAAQKAKVPADGTQALYQTRVLMSFSVAAAPLVMLLLSVALIVVPARAKKLYWGLFQCLACGLAFLVLNGTCEVLGMSAQLPPWLAVLAAPVAFAALGLGGMLRADGAR